MPPISAGTGVKLTIFIRVLKLERQDSFS
jgi:hypothetical protein